MTNTKRGVSRLQRAALDLPFPAQPDIQLQVHPQLFKDLPMSLHDQRRYISSLRSPQIEHIVGVPLGVLRFPVGFPSQPHLVNEMACLLPWRILKDGTGMALRWLRQLAMAFVLSHGGTQLLWICAMEMDPQQHD